MKSIAFGGLDVHDETVVIHLIPRDSETVLDERKIRFEKTAVLKYFRRLSEKYDLRLCYEASGCGYVLHRWLKDIGVACAVIAPSLVPVRAGNRVKTDKRDAKKLARFYRTGDLTEVHIPTEEEESVRSLVRCRETILKEVIQSKNYVLKFLKLRGLRFSGTKSNWTQKHWEWLRSLKFEGADAAVWMEYLSLLDYKLVRLADLHRQLENLAQSEPYRAVVEKLSSLRGIGTLSALVLITETADFRRFEKARQLMAYYGFVPTESSSGEKRWQGSITKTGNARCRRVLVEAAWKYQHKPARSRALNERQLGQPAEVVSHSWKAQHRLHKKFWNIALRKERQKAVVAVARELTGFVWALMTDHFGGRNQPAGQAVPAAV